MKKNISDKDIKDWEDFTSKKDKLPNKDIDYKIKKLTQSKTIDLHGFTLDEANETIEKLITKYFTQNVSKIVVVTGKGLHSNNESNPYLSKDLSILKFSVPEFIKKNEHLMSMISEIKDAKIGDGGSGAFYIFLKKKIKL